MLKKIGHKPGWGQIVMSKKVSVFIMLSCSISSSNRNCLSTHTHTLNLCKFYLQFHHTQLLNAWLPMLCDCPLDNHSILEINLTKAMRFQHCL